MSFGVASVPRPLTYGVADETASGDDDRRDDVQLPARRSEPVERNGGKDGERRVDRHDVAGKLGAREAEEHEDCQGPRGEQDHRPKTRAARFVANDADDRARKPEPGQEADQQLRHEVPPGRGAVVHGREVALEVLVDEEEVRELGVAQRHEDEPGRGDRQRNQGSGDEMDPAPDREVARRDAVDDQHQAGQDDADQALRQQRDRHRRPGEPHPASALAGRRRRVLGDQHRGEHAAERARETHVERVEVTGEIPGGGRNEDERRQDRHARPEPAPGGDGGHHDAERARNRDPQPRLPFADAERLER